MDYLKVPAIARKDFGKGFARRLRQSGRVPAVLYARGQDNRHVSLPAHRMELIVRRPNSLLVVEEDGIEYLVLVKDVQRDPVRQVIEHIDLLRVAPAQRVQVRAPLRVVGQTFAGTLAAIDNRSIKIEVEAKAIPEAVVVDIDGLQAGKRIFAEDLDLPPRVKLISQPRALVVKVNALRKAPVAAVAEG